MSNTYFGSIQLFCMNQNHATYHIFANTQKSIPKFQNKLSAEYVYLLRWFQWKKLHWIGHFSGFYWVFFWKPCILHTYTVKVKNENHLKVKCVKQKLFNIFQITVTFIFIFGEIPKMKELGPGNVFFFIINQSISQNQGFWPLSPLLLRFHHNNNLEHMEQLLFKKFYPQMIFIFHLYCIKYRGFRKKQ